MIFGTLQNDPEWVPSSKIEVKESSICDDIHETGAILMQRR